MQTTADINGIEHWVPRRELFLVGAVAWTIGAILAVALVIKGMPTTLERSPLSTDTQTFVPRSAASPDTDELVMPEDNVVAPRPGNAEMQRR